MVLLILLLGLVVYSLSINKSGMASREKPYASSGSPEMPTQVANPAAAEERSGPNSPAHPPSPEIANNLPFQMPQSGPDAGFLKRRMSTEGGDLPVVQHPDGRRSIHLGGRFMHMSALVTGPDGKTTVKCFFDANTLTTATADGAESPAPPATNHPEF